MLEDSVFISGKFKVIHSGHSRLFKYAKTIRGKLIVGLDTEDLSEEEISWRVSLLKNHELVDDVILINSNLEAVLMEIQPSIVIKGREFVNRYNPEKAVLESFGGELVFSSGNYFYSDEDLIEFNQIKDKDSGLEAARKYLKRNNISSAEIFKTINKFSDLEVCVIGDLIVDEFINCHPIGMSREEPTVVVTPIDSRKFLGGAGIVAGHVAALGAKTFFLTVMGSDDSAVWAENSAKEMNVRITSYIDKNRPTTLKQRFRSGRQTLLKLSHLDNSKIPKEAEEQLINRFKEIAENLDLLILSDFSYGIFSDSFTEQILRIAKASNLIISADSQTSSQIGNLLQFRNVDLICATEIELRHLLNDENSGLAIVAENARSKLNVNNLIIKLGSDGVLIHYLDENRVLQPTEALPAFNSNPQDVSGAGDSLLAVASMAFCVNRDIQIAGYLGSLGAAIQISRIGNIPIRTTEFSIFSE